MPTRLQCRVPPDAGGRLLATWLAGRFTYFDDEGWRRQIAAGRVLHNGGPADAAAPLRAGDHVVFLPAPAPPRPDLAIPVLHADDDLIAVDKPPHLVAHRDGAFVQNTFLHELERRWAGGGPLHLVHRLDRETSGVLLLARHAGAAADLQRQFAAGAVTKEYVALVHGRVAADRFPIDAPIGPAGAGVAARRAVLPAGATGARAAVTDVAVESRLPGHTLLRIRPRTGRTHQIRVHLEHAGHPIVGDKLYGQTDVRYSAYVRHLKAGGDPSWPGELPAGRQMLHAQRLELRHPRTGAPLVLKAPVPGDFAAMVATLAAET